MSHEDMQENDQSIAVLAYRVGQLEEQLKDLKKWIVRTAGTLLLSLIMLVLNLALRTGAGAPIPGGH